MVFAFIRQQYPSLLVLVILASLVRWSSAQSVGMAKPELVVQRQHMAAIYSIAFSPDGRLMASGSWDNTVKIWDVATRKQLRTLAGHELFVNCVAFSRDGKSLGSASYDGKVKIWNIATGEVRYSVNFSNAVLSVAFSSKDNLVAAGTDKGKVVVWDYIKREPQCSINLTGPTNEIESLAFSSDGAELAGGGGAMGQKLAILKVWAVKDGTELASLDVQRDRVYKIAYSPDGKVLASGSWDSTVKLWDAKTHAEIATLDGRGADVSCLAFTPDGKTLVISSLDRKLHIWDIVKCQQIASIDGHTEQIRAMAFNPQNRILATGAWDNSIRFWDISSRAEIGLVKGERTGIWAIEVSADGKYAAGAYADHKIRIWDTETWRTVRSFSGHSKEVSCLKFSPDGKTLCSGSFDKTIRFWNVTSGKQLKLPVRHSSEVTAVTYSPNGRWVVSSAAGSSDNGGIKVWDAATPGAPFILPGENNQTRCLTFSANGYWLASGSRDGRIKIWDVKSGNVRRWKTVKSFTTDRTIAALRFSRDMQFLASAGGDNQVRIWNLITGKEVVTPLEHAAQVECLDISPDGKLLASGGWDDLIKIWSLPSGQLIHTLKSHSDDVRSLRFSTSSRNLLSGSLDGTVKLWKVQTGKLLLSFSATGDSDFMAFSPEGYYTATRGALASVAFRLGDRAYPFEQFDLQRNRPDLILKNLDGADPALIDAMHQAYKRRLEAAKFSESSLEPSVHLPDLNIDETELSYGTQNPFFTCRATASDSRFKLDRLRILVNDVPATGFVNGKPFGGSQGFRLSDKRLGSFTANIKIRLVRGINKVQISCSNDHGTSSIQQPLFITYTPPAAERARKPKLFVLTVGISRYSSKDNLQFAAKDAKDIANFFKTSSHRFREIEILSLTDCQATKRDIQHRARMLLSKAEVEDEVVFYLAGHGVLDEKLDYYFAPYNMDFLHPAKYGLRYQDLENLLDGVAAQRKLLLLDTCHAGEVDKAASTVLSVNAKNGRSIGRLHYASNKNAFILMEELFTDLRRGSGAAVISASRGLQKAQEKGGNGIFTRSLLVGLRSKKADLNADGKVMINELSKWVQEDVVRATYNRQTPTVRRESVEFDWEVM